MSTSNAPLIDHLAVMFAERVRADGDRTALHVIRDGQYQPRTWNAFAADVRRAAGALMRLGVSPGDRVIQVAENRYEWLVADLAILYAQAVHVPVHAMLTGPQIAYQIEDSGAQVVLVSGAEQTDKISREVSRLSRPMTLVSYDPANAGSVAGQSIACWPELLAATSEDEGLSIEQQALAAALPDALATILYTSGTTGEPKGVMLSHRNLASNARASVEAFGVVADDLRLTWLPLSHIFARTCDFYSWIATGTQLALAESRETVLQNCQQIRPTLINGVPYFYEKVMQKLVESGQADAAGVLSHLFGGRMRLCCSGGAALPDHIATFFTQRGLLLIQGYGLTECAPVMTMNTERAHRLGTVGQPPRGVEVRIASDGEILTRGPHVMLGYWNRPQATAEALKDGWLYSGDLGQLDADGYLSITGRKKELIVTSAGKNIAPVMLESLLTADPLIQQALVVGDGRSYLTALIVMAPEALRQELDRQKMDEMSDDPCVDPRIVALYQQRINARLAGVSPQEQVRKFTLLSQPFTVESGELTPTLKLRRGIISERHAAAINAMYARAATIG
ncbi:MAG: long-chain fatty acid--CoA ligase [Pirellulales bacterium]